MTMLNRKGAVNERDYRLARGVFTTLALAEIAMNPASRKDVPPDENMARDLVRSLRHGLGSFSADIVTEATYTVPAQGLYQVLRLDPNLCVASSGRVMIKAKPGTCMLCFTGLTATFKGASDGQIPTLDDAESVVGCSVRHVSPVENERAFCVFEESLHMGPIFPVSPETMARIMHEASEDKSEPAPPLAFDAAQDVIQGWIKTASEALAEGKDGGGTIDPAGRVPSVVDPVQHPENPERVIRLMDVLGHELSTRGWRPVPFLSHQIWISPEAMAKALGEDTAKNTPAPAPETESAPADKPESAA